MADPRLAGIVLAAGGSTRLGRPKQLLRHRGETLVANVARLAQGACGAGVTVVTGACADEVEAAVAGLPVATCRNDAWERGLAGSLACGVRSAPPAAGALLVLLCDQPLVEAADVERLLRAWSAQPAAAAAAFYGGRPGVPAIFPRTQWPALLALEGDRGAAAVLRAPGASVTPVPMPSASVDVDDPAALRLLSGSPAQAP